jgi:DNA-binding GntR family transcriptional regulator
LSFPALDTFEKDPISETPSTWKVYMHLQRSLLNHTKPMPVKVRALAQTLRVGPGPIIAALNVLIERGYLLEHSHDKRGVRHLTLAWSVEQNRFPPRNSSAA